MKTATEGQEIPPLLTEPIASEFTVSVDTRVYAKAAIFKTCYAFTDRCYLWLATGEESILVVHFARRDILLDIPTLKGEFANALIDFMLRERIEQTTRDIRTAIVNTALLEASGRPPQAR